MQNTAIAHEQAAGRVRNNFARRGYAVLPPHLSAWTDGIVVILLNCRGDSLAAVAAT